MNKNWTSEVPDTSGMAVPVRCTNSGDVFDLATVTKAQITTCRCGVSITDQGTPPATRRRSEWAWKASGGTRPGDFWCPDGQQHTPAGGAVNLMWRTPCCDILVTEDAAAPITVRSFKDYVRLDRS
jgi:hypothetical protein